MQEKLEKWLSEVFAMRVTLRPMRVGEAAVEDRFDVWKVRGLIAPFALVTPKPGVGNPSVGEIGRLVTGTGGQDGSGRRHCWAISWQVALVWTRGQEWPRAWLCRQGWRSPAAVRRTGHGYQMGFGVIAFGMTAAAVTGPPRKPVARS